MVNKIKSINAPKGKGFFLECAFIDEGKISILFSNNGDRNDLTEIAIDWAIHFQRTDDSYKINTFFIWKKETAAISHKNNVKRRKMQCLM